MKKKYTFRKFINDIHLWLGLASGLVLFVVCLSGTVYTFSDEIQELLDPAKYKAIHRPKDKAIAIDTLITDLQKKQGGQLAYLIVPHDDDRAYTISLRHKPKDRFGTAYYVNQFSGQLQGNGDTKSFAFFMWTMNLHRWLLMKEHGGIIIVGVATLIFVVLSITGLFLWVPRKLKSWRQGFTIKYRASWKRVNYDLHNTLGFYALPLLMIMALTGLCWSFEWYSNGMSKVVGAQVWGEYYAKPITSAPANGRQQTGIGTVIAQADSHFKYNGDLTIFLPKDSMGTITLQKTRAGKFALAAVDKLIADQYTGQALKVEHFSEKSGPEQLVSLVRPLHIGSVYGLGSKIIYFLACLIATSLPVTGFMIFWNKLKKST